MVQVIFSNCMYNNWFKRYFGIRGLAHTHTQARFAEQVIPTCKRRLDAPGACGILNIMKSWQYMVLCGALALLMAVTPIAFAAHIHHDDLSENEHVAGECVLCAMGSVYGESCDEFVPLFVNSFPAEPVFTGTAQYVPSDPITSRESRAPPA